MDRINRRWGHDCLRTAAVTLTSDWGMRRPLLSPSYMTSWDQRGKSDVVEKQSIPREGGEVKQSPRGAGFIEPQGQNGSTHQKTVNNADFHWDQGPSGMTVIVPEKPFFPH
ncbi:DUF4113 domain-containing protein [Pseudomonas kairouanensis]|uniref:DUF4113 domain-containing protein n=1 Tax=Pseudomonas kairouanensis TaxID=2293832 RepID=UPI001EE1B347|nr:DUF4113 domain-containing protein [Pseudomonas kairouanensis]